MTNKKSYDTLLIEYNDLGSKEEYLWLLKT